MHGLRPEELLRLFELGHGLDPLDGGLLLLAAAWPEADDAVRRALPIAERDRLLVALRVSTFGPAATVEATCSRCDQELEIELDLRQLLAAPGPDDPFAVHQVEVGGESLRFRLPSTADLEAVRSTPGEEPQAALVGSTLVSEGGVGPHDRPSEAAVDAVAAAWDEIDPLSEVRLAFDCPECAGPPFDQVFDIATFLRAEIEVHARRLLLEIHALASAYGWTETEVLALGSVRRRLYVEMVS